MTNGNEDGSIVRIRLVIRCWKKMQITFAVKEENRLAKSLNPTVPTYDRFNIQDCGDTPHDHTMETRDWDRSGCRWLKKRR